MADLLDLEPEKFRLCWYSDSVDASFLIEYVPETEDLKNCSGGSGHGFKFLPVLGKHVVDVVEGRDTAYTRLFKWREVPGRSACWSSKDRMDGSSSVEGGWSAT